MSYKSKRMNQQEHEELLTNEVNAIHDKITYHKKMMDKYEKEMNKYKNKRNFDKKLSSKYYGRIMDLDTIGEDIRNYKRESDKELSKYIYKKMFDKKVLGTMSINDFLTKELNRLELDIKRFDEEMDKYKKKYDNEKKKMKVIQDVLDLYLKKLDLAKKGELDKIRETRADSGENTEMVRVIKSVHQANYYKRKGGK